MDATAVVFRADASPRAALAGAGFSRRPRTAARHAHAAIAVAAASCRYRSLRQFTEPRVSTVLDSISRSKPLRSRYFRISTWPLPTIDTP